jgi:hypothetical protein
MTTISANSMINKGRESLYQAYSHNPDGLKRVINAKIDHIFKEFSSFENGEFGFDAKSHKFLPGRGPEYFKKAAQTEGRVKAIYSDFELHEMGNLAGNIVFDVMGTTSGSKFANPQKTSATITLYLLNKLKPTIKPIAQSEELSKRCKPHAAPRLLKLFDKILKGVWISCDDKQVKVTEKEVKIAEEKRKIEEYQKTPEYQLKQLSEKRETELKKYQEVLCQSPVEITNDNAVLMVKEANSLTVEYGSESRKKLIKQLKTYIQREVQEKSCRKFDHAPKDLDLQKWKKHELTYLEETPQLKSFVEDLQATKAKSDALKEKQKKMYDSIVRIDAEILKLNPDAELSSVLAPSTAVEKSDNNTIEPSAVIQEVPKVTSSVKSEPAIKTANKSKKVVLAIFSALASLAFLTAAGTLLAWLIVPLSSGTAIGISISGIALGIVAILSAVIYKKH